MKNHSKFGKVFFWFGFLLFILGFMFNEEIGVLAEDFYPFSLPAIIIGITIIIISNFFKKKKI